MALYFKDFQSRQIELAEKGTTYKSQAAASKIILTRELLSV